MGQLDFKGRVAIVTGSGSGMGREHAIALAARGARVVVNDVAAERAAETVMKITETGGEAVANDSDVTVDSARLVATAIERFGRLDILTNNAGIVRFGTFWEQDPDEWWTVFNTHLRGTVETTRYAMPYLIKSGSGRVINISSSATLGSPKSSAYCAGKAAIYGFSNSLAMEAAAVGVQVIAVMPSAWTPMTEFAFDDPAVRQVMKDKLPARAVGAFLTWLAHQDTTVSGGCVQTSGDSACQTAFAVRPRIRAASMTPEAWADEAERLRSPGDDWTPLWSTGDSFRAELVFADSSLETVLPADPIASQIR
ncbi:MAG: SDR family NAD(P)-dependent oxidoreductase [Thermoleophilia bacterium]